MTNDQTITPAEMRVKIAKDVLKHIKAGRMIPSNAGVYFRPGRWNTSPTLGTEVSKALKVSVTKSNPCTVCGIGGIFYSAVVMNNELTFREALGARRERAYQKLCKISDDIRKICKISDDSHVLNEQDIMLRYLKRWFGRKTLEGIENAFEAYYQKDVNEDCIYAYRDRTDAQDRMELIMEHVIRNKGQFKPRKFFQEWSRNDYGRP